MVNGEKFALKPAGEKKYTIDMRGLTCPYPEILARRALSAVATGESVEITLDNVPSVENIPAAAEEMKHEVIEVKKIGERDWRIVIRKQ